ncbi:MAG: hypothetical protein JXN61_13180 [Sedimentisphaerales bacterium]|nr:hypothetical protein [Sedimentisphaerales bacterium]
MKRFRSVFLTVVVGLVVAGIVLHGPRAFGAEYTAQALIEVLPYVERDPFVLEAPPVDKDLQYQFRMSIATLITTQGSFEDLLKRDRLRQTKWYKQKGGESASRISDLQQNLHALALKESNFIEVSMVCEDAREAADIANEMVAMFISMQGERARANIANRLSGVKVRQNRIEEELRVVEKALSDVREAWSLPDLEGRDSPHPIAVRLIRLEEAKDALALEIGGVEAAIEHLNKAQKSSEDKKLELAVLRGKFTEAARMCKETQAKQKDLDTARIQYNQRVRIIDERIRVLDEVKMLAEKLTILHDDPDTVKLRKASDAMAPLSPDP